ncbi:Uncharacterised protein [Mycobacterium tuberculosis]|nr:Uncharacterised protein [Mycobacterium tuberculosis]COZ16634.1 Uncharacterised protein [Mycobacterium tuberculosis]
MLSCSAVGGMGSTWSIFWPISRNWWRGLGALVARVTMPCCGNRASA